VNYFAELNKKRIKDLQKSIKQTLELLGWSLKDFVGKYMIETHDSVDEEDINQFYGTVRKQMERDSTKEALLVKYHAFLFATDEYKQLRTISDKSSNPSNYQLMNIPETAYKSSTVDSNDEEGKVLSMAISYAEAMGSCWDFTLIRNDLASKDLTYEFEEPIYIVVYQCDFGFGGGSGCREVGLIEVWHSRLSGFYIADKKCKIDMDVARFSHVVGMKKGELTIVGKDFDSLDNQAIQTLLVKVILSRDINNSNTWKVKSKEYIHKYLEFDLDKLESGYK